ncbi:MAG TPA: ISAs1 family transposase [Gaiellales bacterium]|nr:ISAs1 family transposase [Gaiellales bacterium]
MPASSSSLSPLIATITGADVPVQALSVAQSIRLLQALSAVPDPRRRRGRRYSLQSILLIAVSAVLAGARSYAAIGDWAAVTRPAVGVCGRPPHAATIRRVLMAVDPVAVQAALTAWALAHRTAQAAAAEHTSLPRNERRQLLAVDGKSLRGARRPDGQQTKLLAVIDHAQRLVLTQTEVVDGNEIAAFVTALDTLAQLRGCLITADALHTQRGHAEYLLGRGAHYLFTVKDNQPTLRRALAALPWRAAPNGSDPGPARRHGRVESRTATVIDLEGTEVGQLFPGAARAMKIVRRRIDTATGVASTETVYAITSLGHRYADAVLLAIWLRGHWQIENALHWVRDVTFGEDHSAVRTGAGPQVMAALRNTAINVSRLAGHTNIAAAQRRYSWTPGAAVEAITAA